ncbi:MAG TPA: FixH family protein [Edaphobacter sp.]|nr:FixH family protein [Edaphobacter sp.]
MGCRRAPGPVADIKVQQQITPQPVRVGAATMTIQLEDTAGRPITDAGIKVEADMAHPGMAPFFAEAKETTPGNYVSPLTFSMGGDWVVLLHLRLADGQKVERRVDVGGVRSN